jgi:hypothetical protein
MNAIANGFEKAGRRLAATPSAVFLAVLTAGLATASFARHAGLYQPNAGAGQKNIVLACPRTRTNAHPTTNGAKGAAPTAARQKTAAAAPHSPTASPAATAESTSVSAEKHQTGRTGSGGLSVPLPDFNAPELSRFISPL